MRFRSDPARVGRFPLYAVRGAEALSKTYRERPKFWRVRANQNELEWRESIGIEPTHRPSRGDAPVLKTGGSTSSPTSPEDCAATTYDRSSSPSTPPGGPNGGPSRKPRVDDGQRARAGAPRRGSARTCGPRVPGSRLRGELGREVPWRRMYADGPSDVCPSRRRRVWRAGSATARGADASSPD